MDAKLIRSGKPFKRGADRPLLLWCSSHGTLAREEIPLFLEAGFRVVPLCTDMWTMTYKAELDETLCSDWKAGIDLPEDVVRRLQAMQLYYDFGCQPLRDEDTKLLNEYVDVAYLTVVPHLADKLTTCFQGSIIFRPFGHGSLNTYTRIAQHFGADLDRLQMSNNYIWCPILSTLEAPEDPRIWKNPQPLGAFVTRDRLGAGDWDGPTSRPTLIETIPRINKQDYYRNIYDHYISQYGQLPLEILGGGNEVAGGEIGDPRIVGPTKDDEYFRRIRTARLCIYHGDTPYHVHYHPIEFMAVGTPVLFHVDSALAEEARAFDLTEAELDGMGMYHNAEHARQKAAAALRDWRVAQAISEQQRFFMNVVFNRDRVLRQAIALKQHCTAQLRALRNGYPTNTEHQPPAPPNEKPVLSTTQKFAREIRRIGNQIRRRVAG